MATEPEILKEGELIVLPPTELSRSDLQNSIIALEKDAIALPRLKEQADSIEVKDAESYAEIGKILTEARTLKETPKNRLGTFYTIVERVYAFLDSHSDEVKHAIKEIEGICLPKMKAYEQKELEAKRKEQDAINKRNEKKGLPLINAKPTLPAVSGYRRSTVYKATFDSPEDFNKLLRRFFTTKSRDERTYLRKFLTWDEQELNAEAREVKDPKEVMKRIPGSRAWQE